MIKSHCCNADMIYLGKNDTRVSIHSVIGDTFNYCCYKCGRCEWSTEKEKSKYKWYKFDKDKLKEHLTNRYNNGTESISYRQVFLEIREMMQKLEQGSDSNENN